MKHAALLTLALLAGCASFTPEQSGAEATYQVLAAIDYGQTSNVARRPDCMSEAGPAELFLGSKPSQTRVSAYFAVGAAAHYGVSAWLAREASATGADGWYASLWLWEIGGIALEANEVMRNWQLGSRPGGHGLNALCAGAGHGY